MSGPDRPPAGIGDILGPQYPGNLAYGDQRQIPTNYGTVGIDNETIWRFWNGAKQEVIGGHWEARCPCCYTKHTVDGTSDDARADLVDAVLDCCDEVRWLPPSDYLDPCPVCNRTHRERNECTAPAYREPVPDAEAPAECTDCEWTTNRLGDAGTHDASCPECGSNAVDVLEAATDGGVDRSTSDTERFPEVVCLCGSTRFKDEYRAENARLTLEGKIVLSVGFFHHSGDAPEGVAEAVEEFERSDKKADLDELHKRKIDLADRIHVINVDGYVGDSTASEIEYARETDTNISWYESRNARQEEAAKDRSDDEPVTDGGLDLDGPQVYDTSLEDHIIAECPLCLDAMLLGKYWKELIVEDGHGVPVCPDCEPEEWAEDAEPKIDGLEIWALQEDRIDLDGGGG